MKNQNAVIKTLREKAAVDPVLNAVLHMWALRKRARNQVTIHALAARMTTEGFSYTQAEYVPVLKILGELGLGRLETVGKRTVALRDVTVTLQSIGMAVLGKKSHFDAWKPRNRYESIAKVPSKHVLNRKEMTQAVSSLKEAIADLNAAPPIAARSMTLVTSPLSLGIPFKGRTITIALDPTLSDEELIYVVKHLRENVATA